MLVLAGELQLCRTPGSRPALAFAPAQDVQRLIAVGLVNPADHVTNGEPADRAGVQQTAEDGDHTRGPGGSASRDLETARLGQRSGSDRAHVDVLAPVQE